jgi:hypothetical protein
MDLYSSSGKEGENIFQQKKLKQTVDSFIKEAPITALEEIINTSDEDLQAALDLSNNLAGMKAGEFKNEIRRVIELSKQNLGTPSMEAPLGAEITEEAFNAEQERIRKQQELKKKAEQATAEINRKFSSEGQDAVEQATFAGMGNEVKNEGAQTDLFGQGGYSESVGDYAEVANETERREARNRYATVNRNIVHIPELLSFIKSIGGRVGIKKNLREGVRGRAKGLNIELLGRLFSGKEIAADSSEKRGAFDSFVKNVINKFGGKESDYYFTKEYSKQIKGYIFRAFDPSDKSQIAKTLSHEIGHVVDYSGEPKGLKGGTILAKIASLKKYLKHTLAPAPGEEIQKLTPADKKRLKAIATELATEEKTITTGQETIIDEQPFTPEDILSIWNDYTSWEKNDRLMSFIGTLGRKEKASVIKEALAGKVSEYIKIKKQQIKVVSEGVTKTIKELNEAKLKEEFNKLIHDEMIKREIFHKGQITDELKALSKKWRPWDEENADKWTKKYRNSPDELYADAWSVLLNDPELLRQDAPMFYRAFFNYLGEKPEVKAAYDEIQTLIDSGEQNVIAKSVEEKLGKYRESKKKMLEALNKIRNPKMSIIQEILKYVQDKDILLTMKINSLKNLTPEQYYKFKNIVDNYAFQAAISNQFGREVDEKITSQLRENGISEEEFDLYLSLNRSVTERRFIANPDFGTSEEAQKRLDYMKEKLGEEKFKKIEELQKEFSKIWHEYVVTEMEQSGSWSSELMEAIKNNQNYVYFQKTPLDYKKYFDAKYGKGGSGIFKQYGMLNTELPPFTLTIMRGVSLLRAAKIQKIKHTLRDLMSLFPEETFIAEKKYSKDIDGLRILDVDEVASKDKYPAHFAENYKLVTWLDNGKMEGMYIDKDIALFLDHNPRDMGRILRTISTASYFVKSAWVKYNPGWAVLNPVKDTIHSFSAMGIKDAAKYTMQAIQHAKLDAKGESTELVKQMYKKGELIPNRTYESKELDTDDFYDKLIHEISGITNDPNTMQKIGIFINQVGVFGERLSKIAGRIWANEMIAKGQMNEEQATYFIRNFLGTPNALRRGLWTYYLNNLFPFSNINMQGIRAAKELAFLGTQSADVKKQHKPFRGKFWIYIGVTVLAPVILEKAIEAGLFGETYKKLFKNITKNDRARYFPIVFGQNNQGKTIYFPAFSDPFAMSLKSVLYRSMDIKNVKDIGKLAKEINSIQPWNSLNPLFTIPLNAGRIAMNQNPIDTWSGKEIVPREIWDTGAIAPRYAELTKHSWNEVLGSLIYNINQEDKASVDSFVDNITKGYPVLSPILKRFIRVSDAGKYEEEFDKLAEKNFEKAELRRGVNEAILDTISSVNTISQAKNKADTLYRRLRSSKQLNSNTTIKEFRRKYATYVINKFSDDESVNKLFLSTWNNKKERERLINENREYRKVYNVFSRLTE